MSTLSARGLGQLFVLELQEDRWNRSLAALLRSFQPAGVVVPAKSMRSPETTGHLLRRICSTLDSPPFLGVADEDPRADPQRGLFPSFPGLPLPFDAARKGLGPVERLGSLRGALLRLLGFNVDFWFALDLTRSDSKTPPVSCAFASDPQEVAAWGDAYLRGLRRHGILACGKHFPGLGSVRLDPHAKTLLSAKPMVGLWREDLLPFRQLLWRLPLVMISPAAYKAYDFDLLRPAMLSSNIVSRLLRLKLGYQAIAVASLPELERAWVKLNPRDAAVRSLQAGCDVIIVGGNNKSLEALIQAISNALESGVLPPERLEKSLARVAATKKSLVAPGRGVSRRAVQQLASQFKEWLKDYES